MDNVHEWKVPSAAKDDDSGALTRLRRFLMDLEREDDTLGFCIQTIRRNPELEFPIPGRSVWCADGAAQTLMLLGQMEVARLALSSKAYATKEDA